MKTQVSISRPKDESLEAYKNWIDDMAKSLGIQEEVLPEEEYITGWKEFWGK